jgi:hypothetical protein
VTNISLDRELVAANYLYVYRAPNPTLQVHVNVRSAGVSPFIATPHLDIRFLFRMKGQIPCAEGWNGDPNLNFVTCGDDHFANWCTCFVLDMNLHRIQEPHHEHDYTNKNHRNPNTDHVLTGARSYCARRMRLARPISISFHRPAADCGAPLAARCRAEKPAP